MHGCKLFGRDGEGEEEGCLVAGGAAQAEGTIKSLREQRGSAGETVVDAGGQGGFWRASGAAALRESSRHARRGVRVEGGGPAQLLLRFCRRTNLKRE